jgi:hypothetical protein
MGLWLWGSFVTCDMEVVLRGGDEIESVNMAVSGIMSR